MRKPLTLALGLLAGALLAIVATGAPAAHAETTPATFHGTVNGRDTTQTVDLQPGLVVVRARHAGTRNFILSLVLPIPGRDIRQGVDESVSLINHIGPYDGAAAGRVPEAGTYILLLQASGSYEITVEQPPLSQVAEEGRLDFSGSGQQVTPVFIMPAGARRITFTHDGSGVSGSRRSFARVWLYDMAGNAVAGDIYGRLFVQFDPFEGTVELEIILDGPHIFHVDATGAWTLRID